MSSPSASKGPLLRGALGLVLFLCVWEAVPRAGLAPSTLLPAPSMLPAAFLREFNSGIWLTSVGLSLGHYLMGLAVGVFAGVGARVHCGGAAYCGSSGSAGSSRCFLR